MLPRILLTPGEPAGIGPDILVQLAQENISAHLIAIADPALLEDRAKTLGLPLRIHRIDSPAEAKPHGAGELTVYPVALAQRAEAGRLNPANAEYVLQCLRVATRLIQQKQAQALVTGPVHKGVINEAGIRFSGHTEFLAELTHSYPVMMLATDKLRVALATTHLPLADVSAAITPQRLEKVLRILHHDLQQHFKIGQPRILVCGLNPHAGEGGHLGREEIEIIEPLLEKLRRENLHLTGPLPADTLFTPRYLKQADAVLAMYHDQGLPVLKYQGFGRAINMTLGLPIIRLSVDHGTALDLAGSGRASNGSLETALSLAIDLASKQN